MLNSVSSCLADLSDGPSTYGRISPDLSVLFIRG